MKNTSVDQLQLALNLYHHGNYEKALKVLKKFNINSMQRTCISLQLEAVCLAKEEEYDDAALVIEQARSISKNLLEKDQVDKIANEINSANSKKNSLEVYQASSQLSAKYSNIKIISENKNVADLTAKLIKRLLSMGAKFNPSLLFEEQGGNLSIHSSQKENQIHLQVPIKCMPLLVDYDLSIAINGLIDLKVKEKVLNPAAIPVMELMIELFNATNKLKEWQLVFPFFVFKHFPDIINDLFRFRPQTRKLERFLNYYQHGNSDKLLIESFIGSREFTYLKQHLACTNIHTENNSEKGLLAIIDFLNHKVGDGSYVVNTQTKAMEIVGTPDKDSNELCVQYGILDPFLTYFIYGFVDTKAPFIYSGKCEIKLLSGDKLVVLSMSGAIKRSSSLPSEIDHLKNYLPPGIKKQGNIIIVSDLLFPQAEELSLFKEVVKQILVMSGHIDIYKAKKQINDEVVHIINEIAKKNIQFWQNLIATFKKLNIANEDLLLLARHSIHHFKTLVEKQ